MATVSQMLWYGYARRYIKQTIPRDIVICMMGFFDTTLIWKVQCSHLPQKKRSKHGLFFVSRPIMVNDISFVCTLYPMGNRHKPYAHFGIKIHRMPKTVANCTIYYQYKLNRRRQPSWHRGTCILSDTDRYTSQRGVVAEYGLSDFTGTFTVILDLIHVHYLKKYKLPDYHQVLHKHRKIKYLWNISTGHIRDAFESDIFGCWCLVIHRLEAETNVFQLGLKLLKLPKDVNELIVEYQVETLGQLINTKALKKSERELFAFSKTFTECICGEYELDRKHARSLQISFCIELQIRKIDHNEQPSHL